jgi:3-dehydroquinate synthetase
VARIAAGRTANAELSERIDTVLKGLGFPARRSFNRSAVVAALSGDKKREAGAQRWILPVAVGEVEEASDVTSAELDNALDAISG